MQTEIIFLIISLLIIIYFLISVFIDARKWIRHKKVKNKGHLIIKWLVNLILAEILLFIFPYPIWIIFSLIALGFFLGLFLRICKKYPGEKEPIIIDLTSFILSIVFVIIFFFNYSNSKILLALSPLIIILPHFFYIINKKYKN